MLSCNKHTCCRSGVAIPVVWGDAWSHCCLAQSSSTLADRQILDSCPQPGCLASISGVLGSSTQRSGLPPYEAAVMIAERRELSPPPPLFKYTACTHGIQGWAGPTLEVPSHNCLYEMLAVPIGTLIYENTDNQY